MPKARSNKTGFNIIIVHFNIRRKLDNMIQYIFFQCGEEPVLIHQIFIGFEAMLEYLFLLNSKENNFSKNMRPQLIIKIIFFKISVNEI